ncbi:hypothetical protein [Modestobacter altitudinis]|uniref:hypothetical protein n=1 Tax=Modestobacter altitudinis TaxID=2213158 RepID=UPI00110C9EAB|nr:hypothetical protein [Modestobacter altitudinis]
MTQLTELDPVHASRIRTGAVTLAHRWPTALALFVAAVVLSDVEDGTEGALVLIVTGTLYLVMAVLARPQTTWPVLLAVLVGVVALKRAGAAGAGVVFGLVAVVAVVGVVRGSLHWPRLPALQVPAAALFAGGGALAADVNPRVAGYAVAAGLIGHALWDVYHWWVDRIVTRSFAEWCAVFDLALGVGLLLLV